MKQDCVIGRLKRNKVLKKKTLTVPLRSRDNDYSLGSLSITLYEANQPRQMAVHLGRVLVQGFCLLKSTDARCLPMA